MSLECWKEIPGFQGMYAVSDRGRVRSFKGRMPRLLKLKKHTGGYLQVVLSCKGTQKNYYVHQLVVVAFIAEIPARGFEVNHKDYNKINNCAYNLELVTPRKNKVHACARYRTLPSNVNLRAGGKNPYQVQFRVDNKAIIIGSYPTVEAAEEAAKVCRAQLRDGTFDATQFVRTRDLPSGVHLVRRHHKKWYQARVTYRGRTVHLGYFKNKNTAGAAVEIARSSIAAETFDLSVFKHRFRSVRKEVCYDASNSCWF